MTEYFLQYSFYVLILSLLMGVSTWKLYKKMGYNPIFSFIPFYNYYLIQKEVKKPKWWVIFSYFPIVGVIMLSVFHLSLMKKFGKKLLPQQLMTIFLPFIYMAMVNYSSKTEIEDESDFLFSEEGEKKKETFIGSTAFAVVLATVIHTFITQPFGIPTGSMERTLLVGDFLFVNKLNYGYRMPMRPLGIPFLQSTIIDTGEKGNPKDDPKSYVESVSLPYFRLPGWEKPKRNDIIVFNYPDDSVHIAIDRKDAYVKRCIAQAGDLVEFKEGKLWVNHLPEKVMGDAFVQQGYTILSDVELDMNHIYKTYGFLPVNVYQNGAGFEYHFFGLTQKIAHELKQISGVTSVVASIEPKGKKAISYHINVPLSQEKGEIIYSKKVNTPHTIFPENKDWNPDWYGPIRIPKKGDILTLNKENIVEYKKLITLYEGNTFQEREGQFFINGKPTRQYKVKYDYYMMVGDNRDASLDGRFFGYIPETYIVGKPMFTWMSLQGMFADSNSDYQAPFKIRWERMFKAANTGEVEKNSYWWLAVLVLSVFFGWDYIVKIFRPKNK